MKTTTRLFRQFTIDNRGTASVEYLIVLLTLSIGVAAAVVGLGPSLVRFFEIRVMWLALPFP